MSAILLDDTFQTSTLIDTAINELLRQCVPLMHDCLFHLFIVSNSSCNTLAAAGLPTLHDLPGSSPDCLEAPWRGYFHSAGSRWCFWQCEMARHPAAGTGCFSSFSLHLLLNIIVYFLHHPVCCKLSPMYAKNYYIRSKRLKNTSKITHWSHFLAQAVDQSEGIPKSIM